MVGDQARIVEMPAIKSQIVLKKDPLWTEELLKIEETIQKEDQAYTMC